MQCMSTVCMHIAILLCTYGTQVNHLLTCTLSYLCAHMARKLTICLLVYEYCTILIRYLLKVSCIWTKVTIILLTNKNIFNTSDFQSLLILRLHFLQFSKHGAAWLRMVRRGSVWCGVAQLWCGVAQYGAAWLSWQRVGLL
jgi:hypothetical protein